MRLDIFSVELDGVEGVTQGFTRLIPPEPQIFGDVRFAFAHPRGIAAVRYVGIASTAGSDPEQESGGHSAKESAGGEEGSGATHASCQLCEEVLRHLRTHARTRSIGW